MARWKAMRPLHAAVGPVNICSRTGCGATGQQRLQRGAGGASVGPDPIDGRLLKPVAHGPTECADHYERDDDERISGTRRKAPFER